MNVWDTLKRFVANFIKYKDLLFELVKKDIQLKYRNSMLGVLWSMLNPLLMTIVISIVFMTIFKSDIAYFPAYVMAGRIIYQFFAESTDFALSSIQANGSLIRKIYVPKYFFPLSRVCSSFVTTLISLVPFVLLMAVMGVPFQWTSLLFFIPLFYLFGISVGVGLLLSSINIFFRDAKYLYSIFLTIIMYLSPIFYPISIIPEDFLVFIQFNPLFIIMEMFRDMVLYGTTPSALDHLVSILYLLVLGSAGLIVFYKSQDRFIYYL